MNGFYIRWGFLLLAGLFMTFLGAQRYYRDVHSLTPEQVMKALPRETVRMLGRVQAGTLRTEAPYEQAVFDLAGEEAPVSVYYQGDAPDNLRELKTLVVIGHWNAAQERFEAHEIDLVPNYGFIIWAYLTLLPLAIFLFMMEQKVRLLYNDIKEAKIYEPEEGQLD